MTTRMTMRMAVWGLATIALTAGHTVAQELPVVKGKPIVATVQGEPITLYEFNRQIAAMKGERAPGQAVDRTAEQGVLTRMIHMTLIAQEARRMELDKLPEIRKMLESYARVALREELFERAVKDVKADPAEVEKIYQAAVREWKISAVLFENEEFAKSLVSGVGAGREFGDLARTYLEQGKATKVESGVSLKRQSMDPAIGQAVVGMAPGSTSPVIATKSGFVVLRLEEIGYPDNPAERAKAEQIAVTNKRREAFTAFDQALKKKYVKIHREVLDGLDYEADKPGIEALLKDRRVIAEVKGEKPVTVAEMTEELKFQFFHGTQLAAERKRLNAKKEQVLDGMLHRKVFRKEALRLGLEKADSYKSEVKDHERATLFGAVLRKVIAPDIKLKDEEVKAYYDGHRDQYASPEMIRIRSLAFADSAAAQTALESLRAGAEFQWVAGRADAQLDPNAAGVLSFDGRPMITSELPEGLQKAVAGAKAGDVRLYAGRESRFYVLAIQDVIAAQPQPYEEVREEIGRKVLDVKIQTAVEEYAEKLRSLSDVKIYLKVS